MILEQDLWKTRSWATSGLLKEANVFITNPYDFKLIFPKWLGLPSRQKINWGSKWDHGAAHPASLHIYNRHVC